MLTFSKSLPIVATPDVLVCGAGCAGIGAAVAAARHGARTMVIDRLGFGGGFFTAIIGSGFDGFVDERSGQPVVGGIVFEMLERMGVIPPGAGPSTTFNVNGELGEIDKHPDWVVPRCDPERFKRAADEILAASGAKVQFHTQVADAVASAGHVESVIVSNKAGLVAITPKVVIDCTGDGDVAAWAGAAYEIAESLQPMSLHFRIMNIRPSIELKRRCAAVLERAHRAGKIGLYGGPWPAFFSDDDVYFNTIRVPGNNTNPDDFTRAEVQGRADAWRMFELWKAELPEFKDAYFMTSGPVAGARESRRIVGDYMLTVEDIRARRTFDDMVLLGAWRLDRHPSSRAGYHDEPVVPPYEIPFRSLVARDHDNLLMAGRCHSATSEALASTRVTATAMGMGQGAGTAAAIAIRENIAPRDVDADALRRALEMDGAILRLAARTQA